MRIFPDLLSVYIITSYTFDFVDGIWDLIGLWVYDFGTLTVILDFIFFHHSTTTVITVNVSISDLILWSFL